MHPFSLINRLIQQRRRSVSAPPYAFKCLGCYKAKSCVFNWRGMELSWKSSSIKHGNGAGGVGVCNTETDAAKLVATWEQAGHTGTKTKLLTSPPAFSINLHHNYTLHLRLSVKYLHGNGSVHVFNLAKGEMFVSLPGNTTDVAVPRSLQGVFECILLFMNLFNY